MKASDEIEQHVPSLSRLTWRDIADLILVTSPAKPRLLSAIWWWYKGWSHYFAGRNLLGRGSLWTGTDVRVFRVVTWVYWQPASDGIHCICQALVLCDQFDGCKIISHGECTAWPNSLSNPPQNDQTLLATPLRLSYVAFILVRLYLSCGQGPNDAILMIVFKVTSPVMSWVPSPGHILLPHLVTMVRTLLPWWRWDQDVHDDKTGPLSWSLQTRHYDLIRTVHHNQHPSLPTR